MLVRVHFPVDRSSSLDDLMQRSEFFLDSLPWEEEFDGQYRLPRFEELTPDPGPTELTIELYQSLFQHFVPVPKLADVADELGHIGRCGLTLREALGFLEANRELDNRVAFAKFIVLRPNCRMCDDVLGKSITPTFIELTSMLDWPTIGFTNRPEWPLGPRDYILARKP